jgi:hypothetical protein
MQMLSLGMTIHATLPSTCVAVIAVLAVVGAWLARRGVRIDDHPLCRRCGFDLVGKPAQSTRCSECGADLASRKAIRPGNRQRYHGLFGIALSLLVLCVGWGAWQGYRAALDIEWPQHLPVWWLTRQAETGTPTGRDVALKELVRRIYKGSLSRRTEAALVHSALAIQADSSCPWVAGWGEIVESLHDCDRLSYDDWDTYVVNACGFSLELEQKPVRELGDLNFSVVQGPPRTSGHLTNSRDLPLGLYAEPCLNVNGRSVKVDLIWAGNDPWNEHPYHPLPPANGYESIDIIPEFSPAPHDTVRFHANVSESFVRRRPTRDASTTSLALQLEEGPQTAVLKILVRPVWRNQSSNDVWFPATGPPGDRVITLHFTWKGVPMEQSSPAP